jgi:acylphosphatase
MKVCKHVYYSGRVQGVGFRYTAQHSAEGYEVTGFVRNLRDGSVELMAEGSLEQVDAFLSTIALSMAGYIEKTRVSECPLSNFRDFRIQY